MHIYTYTYKIYTFNRIQCIWIHAKLLFSVYTYTTPLTSALWFPVSRPALMLYHRLRYVETVIYLPKSQHVTNHWASLLLPPFVFSLYIDTYTHWLCLSVTSRTKQIQSRHCLMHNQTQDDISPENYIS